MPVFQFEPYENRSIGAILQLMQAPAAARARALREGANAQAEATMRGGQAAQQAAGTIGGIVSGLPAAMQQARDAEQAAVMRGKQAEMADLQLGEAKEANRFRTDFSKILADTPRIEDGSGMSLYDVDGISRALADAGHGAHATEIAGTLQSLNTSFRNEHAAKLATVQAGAQQLQRAGNDPVFAGLFLDALEKNGTYPKPIIDRYRQMIDEGGREAVAKITSALAGPPKLEKVGPDDVLIDLNQPGAGPMFQGQGKNVNVPPGASLVNDKTGTVTYSAPARPMTVAPGATVLENGKPVYTAPNPALEETKRHNRATEDAATSDVTSLTPEGIDAAALNFAKTGRLPPLGQGDKTTRKQIINRSAAMFPGLDIASAKADYDANQASLTAIQKQRDAMGAFEETALKNLDVFIGAAKKVIDTGSPMLNKPLRSISESVLGAPSMAAFNTARRTVIPEFAKILANPGLSGQLSDSARHEVEDVVNGNATLPQILAAAQVLTTDVRNRTDAYDDQIAGIKARISKAGDTSRNESNVPRETGPIQVQAPDGHTYSFPSPAQADAFKKAAGIR